MSRFFNKVLSGLYICAVVGSINWPAHAVEPDITNNDVWRVIKGSIFKDGTDGVFEKWQGDIDYQIAKKINVQPRFVEIIQNRFAYFAELAGVKANEDTEDGPNIVVIVSSDNVYAIRTSYRPTMKILVAGAGEDSEIQKSIDKSANYVEKNKLTCFSQVSTKTYDVYLSAFFIETKLSNEVFSGCVDEALRGALGLSLAPSLFTRDSDASMPGT